MVPGGRASQIVGNRGDVGGRFLNWAVLEGWSGELAGKVWRVVRDREGGLADQGRHGELGNNPAKVPAYINCGSAHGSRQNRERTRKLDTIFPRRYEGLLLRRKRNW